MKEDQASKTALGVSLIRAVHQMIDEVPHILEDPVSSLLLEKETIRRIVEEPERHRTLQARALRSHVVLRSRYAEDRLFLGYRNGIRQYISLGAGYDTFCCRQPDWAHSMKIVELDHPATQSAKVKHFKDKGIDFPENIEFLPLYLEKSTVKEGLSHSRIDLKLPAYVSCLGVLAYLRLETVRSIFQSIAEMPKGSCLVFTFAPNKTDSFEWEDGTKSTTQRAAAHGEPWLTRFEVEGLRKVLTECGFSRISFLEPEEAKVQYYVGRNDLPAPRTVRLCEAVV